MLLDEAKLADEPEEGIVITVYHTLFQRDNRVIGNVDFFRADFRTALGDVTHLNARFFLQERNTVGLIHRVHFKASNTNHETWAKEVGFLIMVTQNMADVLAQETFDTLTE